MFSIEKTKFKEPLNEVFGIKSFIRDVLLIKNGFETREVLAELEKPAIEVIFKRF